MSEPQEDPDNVPQLPSYSSSGAVTPGVHLEGRSAYIEPPKPPSADAPSDSAHIPGPPWGANASHGWTETGRSSAPGHERGGTAEGAEILRRLSLTDEPTQKHNITEQDPRAANPGLSLTGRVISTSFCVPYSIGYNGPGLDWVSSSLLTMSRSIC